MSESNNFLAYFCLIGYKLQWKFGKIRSNSSQKGQGTGKYGKFNIKNRGNARVHRYLWH